MKLRENCPTCGTALGPLHDRDTVRHCESCQRLNPRGFRYCGFCAAPMQSAAEQIERAEVAAPAGGWPSLARELVEMRFYLDRGELDEAFELLAILRERHPGHPELVEYSRGPHSGKPRADTQVHRVVDAVLAGSPSLSSSSLPRRSVPQWNAPASDGADDDKRTRAHVAVPRAAADDDYEDRPTNLDMRPPRRPEPARAKTDRHLGAAPVTTAKTKAPRDDDAKTRAGMTVAVATLQAPAPFGEAGSKEGSKAHKSLVRKRAFKSHKRSGPQAAVEPTATPEAKPRRARGTRFGQHVLGRLGGKGKD